jgi:hypothetical protein
MSDIVSRERPWPDLERPATLRRLRVSNAGLVKATLLCALAPIAIFAIFLQPLAAASLLTGGALIAALILWGWAPGEGLSAPLDFRLYAGCLAISIALCLLGGEDHLFYATWDWYTRDAVLADLVDNKFPVLYRYQGVDFVLRAPLGMYMAPAAIGWAYGLKTAHLALLLQNAFLFGSIFYLVASLTSGFKLRFLALVLMSGPMDAVPQLVQCLLKGEVVQPHFMFWNPLASFWAQLPQLFWAPNHAFSGWMIGTLCLLRTRREIDIAILAVSSIILLFWSPLPLIGAAPLLLAAGWKSLTPALLRPRTAVAALGGAFMLPILAYFSLDAATLNRGWLFEKQSFFLWYPLALVFGLPQLWLLLLARKEIPDRLKPTFFAVGVILVLFPLYRFGATSLDNEMAMRGILTPMFLLGVIFAEVAPRLIDGRRAYAFATLAIVMASAMTATMEIRRALSDPPYEINDCNLLTATGKILSYPLPSNYLAHVEKAPAWLVSTQGRRLEIEQRQCWPGFALMEGK